LANIRPKKKHPFCLLFQKIPSWQKHLLRKKPVFGGYWTFFFITASFGHLKKIGIKELLGSDIWGGEKKIKDPPVLGICGQINVKEPLALLFQKRSGKELVVLGGDLAFFFKKKTHLRTMLI